MWFSTYIVYGRIFSQYKQVIKQFQIYCIGIFKSLKFLFSRLLPGIWIRSHNVPKVRQIL